MSTKRRASKPLMEKKRRDRINQSLAELKELIASSSAVTESNCRRNRLEKADILELTVKHVHRLHKSKSSPHHNNDRLFIDGFQECVKEIKNYLSRPNMQQGQEDSLLRHLDNCVRQLATVNNNADAAEEDGQRGEPIQVTFVWRPW